MTVNGGSGVYDKYGLIDSMIVELNGLEVKGVENMRIVMETIQKLAALRQGLSEEDKRREQDNDQQREDL